MAEEREQAALSRSENIQNLERIGTGLLGYGIIAVLISVPTFLVILLVYILIEFN